MKLVKAVKIDIREELAHEIPYRDTYWLAGWLAGCKVQAIE